MSQQVKLMERILSGKHDASFRFTEVTGLLRAFGFSERIKGSHHIYYREDIEEIINLQPKDGRAKAYQIRQLRNLIIKYSLEVE